MFERLFSCGQVAFRLEQLLLKEGASLRGF
jgi:hypothetical protein